MCYLLHALEQFCSVIILLKCVHARCYSPVPGASGEAGTSGDENKHRKGKWLLELFGNRMCKRPLAIFLVKTDVLRNNICILLVYLWHAAVLNGPLSLPSMVREKSGYWAQWLRQLASYHAIKHLLKIRRTELQD